MVWLNILCSIAVHVFFYFLAREAFTDLYWNKLFLCVLTILCLSVCMYVRVFFVCVTITVSVHLGILPLKQVDIAFVCVYLGILPLQLESRKSLWLWNRLSTIPACGRNLLLKLCSCLLTWTFMSCQKTNSVRTTSFMKLVSSGYQTHLGHGGVDDND